MHFIHPIVTSGSRTSRYIYKLAATAFLFAATISASPQVSTPDDRYKADILLVVAHPDDDTVVSSYLARAIFDHHKRVAVVFCTPGDSGSNSTSREHAMALGVVREIEARRAMSALGIANVWFLNGRDTASQDVLLSLATWPSASVLEQTIRIVRVARPEVVMTWLPSSVAGENHGDHQASGVIATEAFDEAGDPTVFPYQVTAPIRQFENAFEGLSPWQAKKLYYFTDAFDTGFFRNHGPEYDGKEISASRHVSYVQLAAQSAAAYQTQLPDPTLGKRIEAGDTSPAAIAEMQKAGYLPEPVRLWLGKSLVKSAGSADIFGGITSEPIAFHPFSPQASPQLSDLEVDLGGFWGFYHDFWRAHQLDSLTSLRPEIAVQLNDVLTIPLHVKNNTSQSHQVTAELELPHGWKENDESHQVTIAPHSELTLSLHAIAPAQANDNFAEIRVRALSAGKTLYEGSIFVKVSPYVAGQLK
jgi:LmbE family N-acetylglucosaminyl deacetylase